MVATYMVITSALFNQIDSNFVTLLNKTLSIHVREYFKELYFHFFVCKIKIFSIIVLVPSSSKVFTVKHWHNKMATEEDINASELLSTSPIEELSSSPVFNHLTSPRNMTSESSEKSDNSLSDVEEDVPREVELSEQYGRTPPSSRTFSKPCKERNKSTRRKKDKSGSDFKTSPSFASWIRRQSASATSSERAFNRDAKEEISSGHFVNGFDENPPLKRRNRSFTESSLTRKPSQRMFKSIRYRESTCNASNSVHLKEDKSAVCPLERVAFYDTMNMLINLGQGGNSEGKDKTEEETENYEVEELREALWLELQAWRNSTTMLDQDEWLMNERRKINNILDDVIYFHVDKTQKVNFEVQFSDTESESEDEDDGDYEGCCILHPISLLDQRPSISSESNDLAYFNEQKLSASSDVSDTTISTDDDTYKISEFAQNIKSAVLVVSSTLNKLYAVEQLYPSRGALRKDFDKYNSEEFKNSCDTLLLWLNQIKGLYHKLHVMSRLVHVDFDDEKVWKDWIELGLGESILVLRTFAIFPILSYIQKINNDYFEF